MKKLISMVLVSVMMLAMLAGIAGASSAYGVTFTAYKGDYSYNLGQNIYFVIKNESDEDRVSMIYPERLYNGEWVPMDLNPYPSYLPPGTSEDVVYWSGNGGDFTEAGTYRFRVEVEDQGIFYSDPFTLE